MDLSNQRQSYDKGVLTEDSIPSSPIELLKSWLQEAIDDNVTEPYAMSLATCGNDMMPAVRTVLLRQITNDSIIFYTNYLSHKGVDIEQNPNAECLFYWYAMQRQVRVRGNIRKISREQTEAYFQKRPYESQIGAWVSQPQSGEVASRQVIDNKFIELKRKYPEGTQVPTPDFWGGYEIIIDEAEFWQGGANRLHDRILYSNHNSNWSTVRLLP